MDISIEQNLKLFSQLISITRDLCFFTFDLRMNCIRTNAPQSPLLKNVFNLDEAQTDELTELLSKGFPVIMTGDLHFLWIAEGEKDPYGDLIYIHVIGPVFTEEISAKSLETAVSNMQMSGPSKQEFLDLLKAIPFIPITRFNEYGLMLHFCITGEKITVSDIVYPRLRNHRKYREAAERPTDAHGSFVAEQKLIHLISEGNLDFQKEFGRIASAVNLGQLNVGNPIRYMKNMIIVSITLCSRAAISGGLDPEIAYTLSDHYIQSVEESSSLPEIMEVNIAMQNDFVQRVHRVKARSGISPQIEKCCGYIQLHIEKNMTGSELARLCSYSETHLSRKFKQETGCTIRQYIMHEKIQQAKFMLVSGELSIQDITEKLGFESQSYFGKKFKEITGMTPGEYRFSKSQCPVGNKAMCPASPPHQSRYQKL